MVCKIVFAPNSPLFWKSGEERKKKRGNYEAFCSSSKRKNYTEVHSKNLSTVSKIVTAEQTERIGSPPKVNVQLNIKKQPFADVLQNRWS